MVRCFEGQEVIGLVAYTNNLDHWDGSQWRSGHVDRHLGIGQIEDKYYIVHGIQQQGLQDYAEIVSTHEAKQTVLQHNPELYEEMFNELVPKL